MGESEACHQSMAARSLDILKAPGGRVSSPFAVPEEAGLRRQVGEASGPALGNCDFRWTGFSGYGT
jgi:hypothetical protein